MPLHVEASLFKDAAVSDLQLTTKRYTLCEQDRKISTMGYTLLFAHATGMHKESWEPVISVLLHDRRVREAWSFDWPNHGEGAIVNEKVILNRKEVIKTREWAALMAAFVRPKAFLPSSTIAIGHSNGSTSLVLMTQYFPSLPFASIILIAPRMIPLDLPPRLRERTHAYLLLTEKVTAKRRDVWSTREEALFWMSGRSPWREWDPRVSDLFITHGLRETKPGEPEVRLACDKHQEATQYPDYEPQYDAMAVYREIVASLPIHVILPGKANDLEREVMGFLFDSGENALAPDSVQWMADAGHLLVQEKPAGVARALFNVLNRMQAKNATQFYVISKL